MTDERGIEELVEKHSKAILSMDIPQITSDLMPEPLQKLQEQAGGGMAMQIDSYEVLGHEIDGDDFGKILGVFECSGAIHQVERHPRAPVSLEFVEDVLVAKSPVGAKSDDIEFFHRRVDFVRRKNHPILNLA